jgi:hypothetical protein
MHDIMYIVGLVVIMLFILSALGLRNAAHHAAASAISRA